MMVSFQGNGKKGNDRALSALIHSCLLRNPHKPYHKKVILILAASRDIVQVSLLQMISY